MNDKIDLYQGAIKHIALAILLLRECEDEKDWYLNDLGYLLESLKREINILKEYNNRQGEKSCAVE